MLSQRLAEVGRTVLSLAPLAGLAPRPEDRPNGISAMVRVKGEEEWIEPCLTSIRDFADEVIVLDNGAAPRTRKALERLREPLQENLRIEDCPELDLFGVSNLGLERARFRWIIRWDADFVAHSSGPRDIRKLRRYLLGLDPRRYYLVYVAAAEVAGDLFHHFPDLPWRLDGQVHTASPWARYVPVRRALSRSAMVSPDRVLREETAFRVTLESLRVPGFYKVLRWEEPAYFHVNVKSARHTLLRHFWLEWLGQGDFRAFPTLESYARAQVRGRWGLEDLDEAAQYFMVAYCRNLIRVDPDRWGPYPELLRPHLARPRYRVEYRDGHIVGRTDAP